MLHRQPINGCTPSRPGGSSSRNGCRTSSQLGWPLQCGHRTGGRRASIHELSYRPMAEERLYSITEAAAKLGVSPATIATWIRLGIATASRQDELGRNRYTGAAPLGMEGGLQERQAQKRG